MALTAIGVALISALIVACGAPELDTPAASEAAAAPSEPTAIAFSGKTGFDIGDRVPEFEISLTNGSPLTSAEIQSSERPAFLFFFSMT